MTRLFPRAAARAVLLALCVVGCARGATRKPADLAAAWCRPDQPCWPSPSDWQQLAAQLHGTLEVPRSPFEACRASATSEACTAARRAATHPFALQDHPGSTQSTGWLGAWTAAPSAYAVVAADASDIAHGVRFASEHGLRLVIKGTGHDYLGRSSAPDSLLIWTHRMRQVTVHDAFVASGCATAAGVPAVSIGSGTRWLEAYQEVTGKHGRYVQGGGCATVGAAGGFLQGGGFGSWSKKYGIAAASLLEAEVVTADGSQIIANACQHPDLFWALRGGGGGTFGVVTKVTLMTHPLPSTFGSVSGAITATSDAAFRELVARFVGFYGERLNNEHWGEQVSIRGDNSLRVSMTFQGLTGPEAEQVWQPLRAWVEAQPERFTIQLQAVALPAAQMWSFAFFRQYAPQAIIADERPGQPAGHFWWAGDADQVSTFWYAYHSRWIPGDRFDGAGATQLATALFEASRHWTVGVHFNKGQAGAAPEAIERGRATAMNPKVFQAAALAIVAANGDGVPGLAGHEPDPVESRRAKAGTGEAMKILRAVTPDTGSYVNETDYFEPDWQHELWGESYPRLLAIKRKYDPRGLFWCHHCVGSETARR